MSRNETFYKIPDASDVINTDLPYWHSDRDRNDNDLTKLQRVVKAMLDVMTPAQRLEILNVMRDRPSQEGDWPYYIADGEEGIR